MRDLTPENVAQIAKVLKGKPFVASHGEFNAGAGMGYNTEPIKIGTIHKGTIDSKGRLLSLIKIDSTPDGILAAERIAHGAKTDVSMLYWIKNYLEQGKRGIDIDHVSSVIKGRHSGTHVLGFFPKCDPEKFKIFDTAKEALDVRRSS